MNEAEKSDRGSGPHKLLIGAVLVLAATTLLTVTAVFFFLRQRATQPASLPARTGASAQAADSVSPPPASGPFTKVSEADIPGRYKHIDGSTESFIVLYDDHTFMNRDGTTYHQYRWDITPDGLELMWQSGPSRFTNYEGPGVFSYVRTAGTVRRLEKQPASSLTNASVTATGVIAFIRFGETSETNGLIPVNLGGDGKIAPGDAGGESCCHLIRKPGRPEAYLYLRIAGECKQAAYEKVLVAVEYFDSPPADGGGGALSIQYDSVVDPYARTEQAVLLTGSQAWKEASFLLVRPKFRNRQNALGDFRLGVANPNLSVRSVKLVENKPR